MRKEREMFIPWKTEESLDWWVDARCRDGAGSYAELFFSEQLDDLAQAKTICTECPVREPCLAGALARREPWGVWGGELVVKGKLLANKRRRGRPSKRAAEIEATDQLGAQSA